MVTGFLAVMTMAATARIDRFSGEGTAASLRQVWQHGRDGFPPAYSPHRLGVEQTGERAVFASGWGGMVGEHLPDSILHIVEAPHDWLFPKVKVVVHHGGAGTVAASLRSGRPSVICPFVTDQFFWGELDLAAWSTGRAQFHSGN